MGHGVHNVPSKEIQNIMHEDTFKVKTTLLNQSLIEKSKSCFTKSSINIMVVQSGNQNRLSAVIRVKQGKVASGSPNAPMHSILSMILLRRRLCA
ncbi:hypothetical protein NC653_010308 [Populus alba x Populus x berolinensis]|uniref:Uncharacterized protein n=1 Tax=Populus alba x Populus x berolinensis TaxID=444605 RepID=A0AAD6QZU4_9ROSI|nr:hypothetical protein NC653_010308 [Populus alba x Populus x berolinensis]